MVTVRINPLGFLLLAIVLVIILYFYLVPESDTETWLASRDNAINLVQLLSVAIQVAETGGVQVKKVRESANLGETSKGETKEGVNDPLTLGDRFSHHHMFYGLKKAFPQLKVRSEENDDKDIDLSTVKTPNIEKIPQEIRRALDKSAFDTLVDTDQLTVWIDPLDATKEYTENLLQYVTTMVCVARNGKPIIGVIHKPFKDYTAWAWVDHGHSETLDTAVLKNVEGVEEPAINDLKIIVSMSHAGEVKQIVDEAFKADPKPELISGAGAGYKVLEVVKDSASVYLHVTAIKKWDVCAGNAILNALGGRMTTLTGEDLEYSFEGPARNEKGLLATYRRSSQHDTLQEKLLAASHIIKT